LTERTLTRAACGLRGMNRRIREGGPKKTNREIGALSQIGREAKATPKPTPKQERRRFLVGWVGGGWGGGLVFVWWFVFLFGSFSVAGGCHFYIWGLGGPWTAAPPPQDTWMAGRKRSGVKSSRSKAPQAGKERKSRAVPKYSTKSGAGRAFRSGSGTAGWCH